ncbi:MAG: nuclear transport factor 2 family protein [Nitrosomonadales bacterium]|nr:nuclear transport factor 2 family protein [Nitrosomonadales bacterium]
MFLRIHYMNTINRLVIMCGASIVIVASIFTGTANGAEHQLSDIYSMHVDPAAKQQLGEQTYNEVMAFFHSAEKAIETKDLEALMALYSDNYSDSEHDKKSAREIWERIFSRFQKMAMHHNMKLGKVSSDKNMVVFQCSGLLLGAADPKERPITIDNWTNQDHVLVKEGGKWKLIGTYGPERKRLWFDKPMHPLF